MNDIKSKIKEQKIIGIIRGVGKDKILKTVEALVEGGIELLEITLDQDSEEKCNNVIEMIQLVNEEFADRVYLGAGTVITAGQVEKAVAAGAKYIISPNTDLAVIGKTKELNKISIPGAYTPSEIIEAYNSGADFVKIFPAKTLGPDYMRSVLSPINIPLLAVGGVNIDNADQFIAAGAVGVGVGGNLVDKDAINSGNFAILTENAAEFRKKVKQFEVGEA